MAIKHSSVRNLFTFIIFSLIVFYSINTLAQKDLPNPPANFQSIPAGSFIIPMDTLYQSIVPAGQAPFNLKAYGLLDIFLQNGIPIKWAIATTKQRDDIDFSATVERYAPGFIAASNLDFRAGPFIVPDTVMPCGLSTREIINTYGNNVAVYLLKTDITVDIRYTVTHRPKIAVFNNGGNQLIHTKILDEAGITGYDVMDAADIVNLINCYTFVSEPHADSAQVSMAVIEGVREFVMRGGNFLAQCHAIDTYENRALFHTTAGIVDVNTTVSHVYPNADLAFSQMHGPLQENEGGSVHNWTLKNGSNWRPTSYRSVSDIGIDTVVAMGAHLTGATEEGGNVYYLGGHDYSKGGKGKTNPVPDLTKIARVNALRLYLNAVFIPSGNTHGRWANAGLPSLSISCSDSIQLGCTPTGPPGSDYLWTPSTGLNCTTCPNPFARPSVTTTYQVQVTNGCIATDTVRVIVAPRPIAQYTNSTVCQGTSTSFTDNSTGSSFWQWNFGDPASGTSNTSSLQNPSHNFSAAGSFNVSLISGSISCPDTIVQVVVINPRPVIVVNSDTVCSGQAVTLTASGATSYSWSSGETVSSITVNPTTTTYYTVTGTEAGCSASQISAVTVVPPIVPTTTHTNVSCFAGSDGTASISVSGGEPGYAYSWNTSPIQTTAQATALPAGTYTVTITDTIGCLATATAIITEPTVLTLTTSPDNAKCFGASDGSATATASGGTSPYTYSWNTSIVQATAQASNLPAGNYTATGTDAKGCTTTATATITEPTAIILGTTADSVLCFGGNDGSATVTASGGTLPYSYSWNTGIVQTTAQANNLTAGNYTVTVTDANACTNTAPATVDQPLGIVLTTSVIHVKCFGGNDGSATVTVSGGSPGYTYSWNTSPVQTTATAVNLVAGTYIVSISDANACLTTASVTITEPPLLTALTVGLHVKCFGGNDGTATVTATGGTTGYTYSWNTTPVQTTFEAINLVAGTYTVTITDANACTATATTSITEPPLLSATAVASNVTCYNGNDGTTTVSVSGGTTGYTYSWNTSPVQTTVQAINLVAGLHTVTITDANACIITASATVLEPAPFTATTVATDVKCYGDNNGTATATATGGAGGFTYSWNTTPVQTTAQAINLIAGTYTITITDANTCTTTALATVNQPSPIEVTSTFTNPTCQIAGTATASVTGGNSPFTYSWNTTPVQTNSTAVNLQAGNYIVTVTDVMGCQFTSSLALTSPPIPVANFDFTTGCYGATTNEFTDNSTLSSGAITSWTWDFGNPSSGTSNTSTSQNPAHAFDAAGTYTTMLIVSTDQGCKDTILKPVEVYPIPVVNFGPFAEGCESLCVNFIDASTVSTGSIQNWSWNFGDASSSSNTSSQQNPTHCYNTLGIYDVSLTVRTNHGCIAELQIKDMVKINPNPIVNVGPNQKICRENDTYLPAIFNAGPGLQYLWQPTGDTTQTISVSAPGTYSVIVTNQWGCSSGSSANLREVCPPRLFVGNAFSPGAGIAGQGDGINDSYTVYSVHVGAYRMLIFNRWGEIIFESKDKNHHWDGIYRDEPMPIGVYAWIITYEGDSEEYKGPYKLEGSVTVVR